MMMRRNTIAFLLAMLVCMAGMLWVAPHLFSSVQAQDMQRLVLRDSSGRELFSRPAPDGSAFAIRYRHSVALSPVEDWFSVSGAASIWKKRSIRISGPACRISRARQRMYTENGKVVISGYHMALPSFDVRVGRVANHTLLLPEEGGGQTEIPEFPAGAGTSHYPYSRFTLMPFGNIDLA